MERCSNVLTKKKNESATLNITLKKWFVTGVN